MSLSKSEISQFKLLLLQIQARLRGDVQQLTDEALEYGDGDGDSRSPTHIAELGTKNYEQDFSLRFAASEREVLEEIVAALNRIDAGTYGLCEGCLVEGKTNSKASIPKSRLKAIPYARNCIICERKREELSL